MSGLLASIPVPSASQLHIAECFWGPNQGQEYKPFFLGPYFEYYSEQCMNVYHAYRGQIPIRSQQEVLDIAAKVRQDIARPALGDEVLSMYMSQGTFSLSDIEHLDGAIDLVVRLLIMVDVGQFPKAFTGRESIIWGSGTLKDFLGDIFPPKRNRSHGGVKLGTSFTARNLDRIGGLKVQLTTNLADHLLLRAEDKTVLIFHYASFLKNQENDVFPNGFIEETLRTLALLFPQGDKDTKKWYGKQDDPQQLDHMVMYCGPAHRDIDEYNYWHDRLVELKEAFDDPPETTLRRLWNDRRDGTQWYTLWVAIALTVFFGLVQSIEGALQVYKAFHSN